MSEDQESAFVFHCEKIDFSVDRRQCEYCAQVEECAQSGYLKEVDRQHGFGSLGDEQKRLLRLYKTVQRSLKDKPYAVLLEKEYATRISGSTDYFEPPFSVQDFEAVAEEAGLNCEGKALHKEAVYYLAAKAIWEKNLQSSAILDKIKGIAATSNRLFEQVEGSCSEMSGFMQPECDLPKFQNALAEFMRGLNDLPAKGIRLRNLPLIIYIERLAAIFSRARDMQPTVSYSPETRKCSDFLQLVHTCLKIVDLASLEVQP